MKKKFQIQNLNCEGSESTIITNLLGMNGVNNICLNIPNSEIEFTIDNKLSIEKVRLKLSQIGHPIVGDINTLTKKQHLI